MLIINLIIIYINFGMQIKTSSPIEYNVDQPELVENKLSLFELCLCMYLSGIMFCIIPENRHFNAITIMLLKLKEMIWRRMLWRLFVIRTEILYFYKG